MHVNARLQPLRRRALVCALACVACASAMPSHALDPSAKSLYMWNCAACHQANGAGVPGAFPALAGNAFVRGDAIAVVSLLLTGRGGMPNFSAQLADRDIAAVLSYARANFGNSASEITPDEVAALRGQLRAPDVDRNPPTTRH
jgi:cytochrome c6